MLLSVEKMGLGYSKFVRARSPNVIDHPLATSMFVLKQTGPHGGESEWDAEEYRTYCPLLWRIRPFS